MSTDSLDNLDENSGDILLTISDYILAHFRSHVIDVASIHPPTHTDGLVAFATSETPQALYVVLNLDGLVTIASEMSETNLNDFASVSIFIKSKGPIRLDTPLQEQLSVVSYANDDSRDFITNGDPSFIKGFLDYVVSPYFELLASQDAQRTKSNTLRAARKKLKELSTTLNLLELQIHVPELLGALSPNALDLLRLSMPEEEIIQDTSLLNELTQVANFWIKQIQNITNLSETPSGVWSMSDEIQFWASMESALESLINQINQPEVKKVLEILSTSRRFQTTFMFQNNLRLSDKLEETKSFNALIKDLPFAGLTQAINSPNPFSAFETSIGDVFSHLRRWKSLRSFPLVRMIEFVELTLDEISNNLIHLFKSAKLAALSLNDFEELYEKQLTNIFKTLDISIKSMTNILRELMRKRQEKFMVIKINNEKINRIQDRLEHLRELIEKHHSLEEVISRSFVSEELSNQLTHAFLKHVIAADCFDFSNEGHLIWVASETCYLRVHADVLQILASSMNNKMNSCITLDDFVGLFQTMQNDTINMARLVSLIDDSHKIRFLAVARTQVLNLASSFSKGAQDFDISVAQDSDTILNSIQNKLSLKSRLHSIIESVTHSLGEDWSFFAIGSQIQDDTRAIFDKLDCLADFEEWVSSNRSSLHVLNKSGFIFEVKHINECREISIDLTYPRQLLTLPRLTYFLETAGFEVSTDILLASRKAATITPIITSLRESLEIFLLLITGEFVNEAFFASLYSMTNESIHRMLRLRSLSWNDVETECAILLEEHDSNNSVLLECKSLKQINAFQEAVYNHYEATRMLQNFRKLYDGEIYSKLMNCAFELSTIQEIVDEVCSTAVTLLPHASYTASFENTLRELIANALSEKCAQHLKYFVKEVHGKKGSKMRFPTLNHFIRCENGYFLIEPPIKSTKARLAAIINSSLEDLCKIRFTTIHGSSSLIWTSCPRGLSKVICEALDEVELIHANLGKHLEAWNKFGSLLTVDSKDRLLFCDLNIDQALSSLLEIISFMKLIEDPVGVTSIGGLISVLHSAVRKHLENSISSFRVTLFSQFTTRVTSISADMLTELKLCEKRFNNLPNMDNTSFDLLEYTSDLLESKKNVTVWKRYKGLLRECQKALYQNRQTLPSSWIHYDQFDSRIPNLEALISGGDSFIFQNLDLVQKRLSTAIEQYNNNLAVFMNNWHKNRQITSEMEPGQALSILAKSQKKLDDFELSKMRAIRVAQQLNIVIPKTTLIQPLQDDFDNLKLIWTSLRDLWDILEEIRKSPWADFQPRKVKLQLDNLWTQMRNLPALVRHYPAFGNLKNTIDLFSTSIIFLGELRGAALKTRHWNKILSSLNAPSSINYDTLKVLQLLELDIKGHESAIRSILKQAVEEQIIEESLLSIEKEWSTITFETFDFEGKCRLVRNWNFLFDTCQDHVSTLSSMKHLVSHGEFEERRNSLESKLVDLLSIFDIWIEVQKKWAYFEGVFGNSPELSASMSIESARFNNISFEFLNLMKRVNNLTLVIDILSIRDLKATFKKMEVSLENTKRGLTQYLELQRDIFPRFYFLGNDDLLEFIGGSRNVKIINKHIKLMFFGVESLIIGDDTHDIIALKSPEGELLSLVSPVSLFKSLTLTQWLSELENIIKLTIAQNIRDSYSEVCEVIKNPSQLKSLFAIIDKYPAQALLVSLNIFFSQKVKNRTDSDCWRQLSDFYSKIVKQVASISEPRHRRKIEALIIELIHHRDICSEMIRRSEREREETLNNIQQYEFSSAANSPLESVIIRQGRQEFSYGFEYSGVVEKLAITPLIDQCFLAMTQALSQGMGGSPVGPAGTGKTESVKALGHTLGRMVIVFNCGDGFDDKSISRILLGLSKVGCWGCFDEFNRLNTTIMSALSPQIEAIQGGLRGDLQDIMISGKSVRVHPNTGLFVTMNPGYAGRNEMPESMRRLFRSFWMAKPDLELIADIILTSQQLVHTETLSKLIVSTFEELKIKSTSQRHYDFGLRAIKSTLRMCGEKRQGLSESSSSATIEEEKSILKSCLKASVSPRLIPQDVSVFDDAMSKFFTNLNDDVSEEQDLIRKIEANASGEGLAVSQNFLLKASQIILILRSHHGIILVGELGSGKSTILRHTLNAMSAFEKTTHKTFVMDCKALSKDEIFGSLDPITREWTDGLFTNILRTNLSNMKGERSHRVWVIFDGDIDPIWAENLNSVLDDNKVLTLPNGERLELSDNLKIVFEVDNLENATLATISRCGMIRFDPSELKPMMVWKKFLFDLRFNEWEGIEKDIPSYERMDLQKNIADSSDILTDQFFSKAIDAAGEFKHIMRFSRLRAVHTFCTFYSTHISNLLNFEAKHQILVDELLGEYVLKSLFLSAIWAFSGDCPAQQRNLYIQKAASFMEFSHLEIPPDVIEYRVSVKDSGWTSWQDNVQTLDLDPHQVLDPSTIIPTVDTVVHENLIHSLINRHTPLILCGPPGSGKTMTFLKALRKLPNLDLISLNFSKETSPEVFVSLLEQNCEYRRSNRGLKLAPKVDGKWCVVFCDEINLPSEDEFGTQRVIALLRLMVERHGFWSSKHREWVSLEKVQFVGACNDPEDPGRSQLAERFLRHACVVMVDYPGRSSMMQIYETMNRATLKCAPDLRGFSGELTAAMLDVYFESQRHLTRDMKSHYVYSPRELTRWCRGILKTVSSADYTKIEPLVRLWYHEGLRLFFDRLSDEHDKVWTKTLFLNTARKYYPHINVESTLKEPVLFSDWLTLRYEPVSVGELSDFVRERSRVFSEEELDLELILFDDMLDHILRIDRVLRQHQGHMILIGPCASGKTTLTKFVAWMNGIKIVQLRVHKGFTVENFQRKLKEVLISCLHGDKICFIIDESSLLEATFIERMNTLLANSEIPGLFEGDDYASLIKLCAAESSSQGLLLDNEDELYAWFTNQVSLNLHVVFTLSDVGVDNRVQVNSSPALFNRCVLSWMGDWSDSTLLEIVQKKLQGIALDSSPYEPKSVDSSRFAVNTFRDAVMRASIILHQSTKSYPNQFLRFVDLFKCLLLRKQNELDDNKRQLTSGLDRLKETVLEMTSMKKLLSEKQINLQAKEADAKRMLDEMILNQNEAERKREFSVATQVELEKQEAQINKRRAVVLHDLEIAEPEVLKASRGVQNIKKQHLTEMRSMSNPPAAVKMAMESVCVLLGYDVKSWRDVQLVVRKDDFIASIVSFDSEVQLTLELSDYMERVYLSRPDYNYETVDRASKACGPLLQWVIAQLKYYSILENVLPLKQEMELLEQAARKSKAQLIAIAEMIRELEESISTSKKRYTELIREAERVRVDMETIEKKLKRSAHVIESLTTERERWESGIKQCDKDRDVIVGNAVLSSAFAIYCGDKDQKSRNAILEGWRQQLTSLCIPFDKFLSPISFLATLDDIAEWSNDKVPLDNLYDQNFAIKKWSDFTFIIDPSEEVWEILANSANIENTVKTTFLDKSFLRKVEDAMRFGGSVLIAHAELYDPVLDPILRKEYSYTGGRRMVQVGNKMVDFLDKFKIIFFSSDLSCTVPSSLKSRVTIINFTVTSSILEDQALDSCLEYTQPTIYEKRKEIVFLQSDYHIKSHKYRQQLLATLNNADGVLLDDDNAIDALEGLKSKSTDLDTRFHESESVLRKCDEIRSSFHEAAIHLSGIFGVIQKLSHFSTFYTISSKTLVQIFKTVLHQQGEDLDIRTMVMQIYRSVFACYAPSLRNMDRITFALALAITFASISEGDCVRSATKRVLSIVNVEDANQSLVQTLLELLSIELTDQLDLSYWSRIVDSEKETKALSLVSPLVKKLLGSVEPWTIVFEGMMEAAFGFSFDQRFILDLPELLLQDNKLILIAETRHIELTSKIQRLAAANSRVLKVVAMGTSEAAEIAMNELEDAMNGGAWILLQNVHMGSTLLNDIEVKINSTSKHEQFVLFLTCLLDSANIPSSLIANSSVLTYEEAPMFKKTLLDSFEYILKQTGSSLSVTHIIVLMLSWYQAVLQEQLKFVPVSFAEKFDINDNDLASSSFYIKSIFNDFQGKHTIRPDEIPWTEITTMIGTIIYGGKIANEKDCQFCKLLAQELFKENIFDEDFIMPYTDLLKLPPEGSSQAIRKWISDLPNTPPLQWFGLKESVLTKFQESEANEIAQRTLAIV